MIGTGTAAEPASTTTAAPRDGRLRDSLRAVLGPFALSRAVFALVLFLGNRAVPAPWTVASTSSRGVRNALRFLDAFGGQWDSGWYLAIVLHGYLPESFVRGEQSNLAFFPAFPKLVAALLHLLPAGAQTYPVALGLGVLVANVLAVGGLAVFHLHARERFGAATANAAVLLLLAFPTAFFLSCVYTEGMFLLLAPFAWHAASRGRWALAGGAGAALALTRPNGMLLAAPLGWTYLQSIGFDLRKLRPRVLWLALLPLAFLAWGAWLAHLTGDPLTVLHTQRAWGKALTGAATTIFDTKRSYGPMTDFDRAITVAFLAAAGAMARSREHRAGAIMVAAIVAGFAFTGTLHSAARYLLAAFPVFLWMACTFGPRARSVYLAVAWATQIALLVTFARGEWVG